jgi:hypothetical protein
MVYPVLLGEGKRLFADDAPMHSLKLVEATRMGDATTLVLRRGD